MIDAKTEWFTSQSPVYKGVYECKSFDGKLFLRLWNGYWWFTWNPQIGIYEEVGRPDCWRGITTAYFLRVMSYKLRQSHFENDTGKILY